jgi:ATP-dependent Lon protease
VLDEDHYDLDKVKERIVEYLAVRKLKGDMKGPILCFVGPPGVGKTSLGQSIARAMARKFVRISLGGVRDEAEIRGHRRTYIGSIPGRIVQALKQSGAMNPVFMLDEIDKVAAGFQGDPAAALLEVLDPAQNHSFRDHYLEVPVDLSKVLFIATANQLGTVHPALLDRMEIIQLSGYSEEEKLHIARKYLLPRQMGEHGLPPGSMEITDAALRLVISEYTREAGVRNLERQLGAIARKVAAKLAMGSPVEPSTTVVDRDQVDDYLGPARFKRRWRSERPGPVWRPVGLDGSRWRRTFHRSHLASRRKPEHYFDGPTRQRDAGVGPCCPQSHSGQRRRTRSLAGFPGETRSPRARARRRDPEGRAVGWCDDGDGDSVGGANTPVRQDVAMTGEITLSGLVLPVGGIREKSLAARRAGIKTVILPALNEPDLAELAEEIRRDMTFVPVETLEQVIKIALSDNQPGTTQRTDPAGSAPLAAR